MLHKEGLPAPSPLTPGEDRVLEWTGTRAYYESSQHERLRPRKLKVKPQELADLTALTATDGASDMAHQPQER